MKAPVIIDGTYTIPPKMGEDTFQQIYLVENHTRIRKFDVKCYGNDGDRWQTVCRGGRMNYCSVRLAKPVTARKVRVNVLYHNLNHGVHLVAVRVFEAK